MKSGSKVMLPRFDGERDRTYSGFALVGDNASNHIHFVDDVKGISKNIAPYPTAANKKGLQVQMVEDALALGVKHAALNFNFGQLVAINPGPDDIAWKMDGKTFHMRRGYIEHMDQSIKRLSDTGVLVTLILLNYENPDSAQNAILLHPHYDKSCPEHLSAFNTSTPEGLAWFKACMEFIADHYSTTRYPHGRVVNYIVGNEVNSHWSWANMGRVTMEQFAQDYLRTVRVCSIAVRKFSSSARVFISLEHHWNIHGAGDDMQNFAGRPFVDYFSLLARRGGDFDWNLAYHPYPENLFQPRTWNDKSATYAQNTPRITFKNIELLPRYFRRDELLYNGKPRRIILSEQGFHSDGTPEGEKAQAAGYCYAYYKIARLESIDAFILHRHVDHGGEYGLNLGLWRREPNSVCTPLSKKRIYDVFRLADTPQWKEAFAFALPVIGVKSWKDISVK